MPGATSTSTSRPPCSASPSASAAPPSPAASGCSARNRAKSCGANVPGRAVSTDPWKGPPVAVKARRVGRGARAAARTPPGVRLATASDTRACPLSASLPQCTAGAPCPRCIHCARRARRGSRRRHCGLSVCSSFTVSARAEMGGRPSASCTGVRATGAARATAPASCRMAPAASCLPPPSPPTTCSTAACASCVLRAARCRGCTVSRPSAAASGDTWAGADWPSAVKARKGARASPSCRQANGTLAKMWPRAADNQAKPNTAQASPTCMPPELPLHTAAATVLVGGASVGSAGAAGPAGAWAGDGEELGPPSGVSACSALVWGAASTPAACSACAVSRTTGHRGSSAACSAAGACTAPCTSACTKPWKAAKAPSVARAATWHGARAAAPDCSAAWVMAPPEWVGEEIPSCGASRPSPRATQAARNSARDSCPRARSKRMTRASTFRGTCRSATPSASCSCAGPDTASLTTSPVHSAAGTGAAGEGGWLVAGCCHPLTAAQSSSSAPRTAATWAAKSSAASRSAASCCARAADTSAKWARAASAADAAPASRASQPDSASSASARCLASSARSAEAARSLMAVDALATAEGVRGVPVLPSGAAGSCRLAAMASCHSASSASRMEACRESRAARASRRWR